MPQNLIIVGGGVMGAATACFLARDHGIAATVLERDPSYTSASSALSASSIRQQFSQPANIALSQWSLRFLRHAGDELEVAGGAPHSASSSPATCTWPPREVRPRCATTMPYSAPPVPTWPCWRPPNCRPASRGWRWTTWRWARSA